MVLTKRTSDLVCVGMEEVTVTLLEEEEEEEEEGLLVAEASIASGGGALCTRWTTFPSRSVVRHFCSIARSGHAEHKPP